MLPKTQRLRGTGPEVEAFNKAVKDFVQARIDVLRGDVAAAVKRDILQHVKGPTRTLQVLTDMLGRNQIVEPELPFTTEIESTPAFALLAIYLAWRVAGAESILSLIYAGQLVPTTADTNPLRFYREYRTSRGDKYEVQFEDCAITIPAVVRPVRIVGSKTE